MVKENLLSVFSLLGHLSRRLADYLMSNVRMSLRTVNIVSQEVKSAMSARLDSIHTRTKLSALPKKKSSFLKTKLQKSSKNNKL